MSAGFTPLSSTSLSESLLGVGDPVKFDANFRDIRYEKDYFDRNVKVRRDETSKGWSTLILVVISAIIFDFDLAFKVIAVYDCIRSYTRIREWRDIHAQLSLEDPRSNNEINNIIRTEIATPRGSLKSSITFTFLAIISGLILIPCLVIISS